MDPTQQQAAARFGRRFGIGAFAAIMALFVVVCSAQILYQGFSASESARAPQCEQGIRDLVVGVRKARQAAALEVLGERAAVARFRGALLTEWAVRKSLDTQCQANSWGKAALGAVDGWRWAEENAVRYESVDLAPSRRRIQAIEVHLGWQTP